MSSNISTVFGILADRVLSIKEKITRDIATSMLPVVRDRIHSQGLATDGLPIGNYSKGYIAVRTGVYKSNGKVTKGKNKGSIRASGLFTKGKNKGEQRPEYNRESDSKVIISLTRQMESDFSVQPTNEGGYGLGYNNTANLQKAEYAEAIYKKLIFSLTDNEKEQVIEIAQSYTDNYMNGQS